MNPSLSQMAKTLISVFEKEDLPTHDKKISVNPVVSKVASLYEKLRNAMEYREEEVILRASIERILKRRLILGGNGKTTAEPLVKELVWAGYFPDNSLSESVLEKVEKRIDLYLAFRQKIILKHGFKEKNINEWTFHLMSSDIEKTLSIHKEKDLLNNFMFHIMKNNITITDESEETKNAQVFMAVRKSFAKDDLAFLRFHLFTQFFGEITHDSLDKIVDSFTKGHEEIQRQLSYKRKEKIYNFVRKKSAIFFILEDLLKTYRGEFKEIYANEDEFKKIVLKACDSRYSGIVSKVQTAIIRSILFILLTKAFFAFTIEGFFENLIFGKIMWDSLIINTTSPALLMFLVSLFIKTPDKNNSQRILSFLKIILSGSNPKFDNPLIMKKNPDKANPVMSAVFTFLWFLAFLLAFGAIVFVLTKLRFNIISQGVFLFFIAIVSFLSYRIWLTSVTYSVETKQGLTTPFVDFLFMPVIRVGRSLTEGISQFNIFLFLFDFIIETPFKGLFEFFEQWFGFLHSKREEME